MRWLPKFHHETPLNSLQWGLQTPLNRTGTGVRVESGSADEPWAKLKAALDFLGDDGWTLGWRMEQALFFFLGPGVTATTHVARGT